MTATADFLGIRRKLDEAVNATLREHLPKLKWIMYSHHKLDATDQAAVDLAASMDSELIARSPQLPRDSARVWYLDKPLQMHGLPQWVIIARARSQWGEPLGLSITFDPQAGGYSYNWGQGEEYMRALLAEWKLEATPPPPSAYAPRFATTYYSGRRPTAAEVYEGLVRDLKSLKDSGCRIDVAEFARAVLNAAAAEARDSAKSIQALLK